MNKRRVVITGTGAVSPFGLGTDLMFAQMLAGHSAIGNIPAQSRPNGLRSDVAAVVPAINPKVIDRKKRRFMSAMSIYSTLASMQAVEQAGLASDQIASRRTGLSLASTMGSTSESEAFFGEMFNSGSIENIKSTMFFKTMNHSCAANTAQALGVRGRIFSPSAACASGTLAIGMGYESILAGHQDIMICGGTDEYHCLATAVFDIMEAGAEKYNDDPENSSRPFDISRAGVVCAEGSGVIILEDMDHAIARGANIIAEMIGFATFSSPDNLANPDKETMVDCMNATLAQSQLNPADVDYINAHATATTQGDIAEGLAIEAVFGDACPVSSLKGHMGHTMAASGALELISSITMAEKNIILPTRNLVNPDKECGKLDHVMTNRNKKINTILKNSFALGGINSTIIIKLQ